MQISNNYIAVEKVQEPIQEGFKTVQMQDNSTFKGKVVVVPEQPVFIGNQQITIGDIVVFAKYSPNTHDIAELQLKFVKTEDVLCIL